MPVKLENEGDGGMEADAELEVGRSLYLMLCFSRTCCCHCSLSSSELEIGKKRTSTKGPLYAKFFARDFTPLSATCEGGVVFLSYRRDH